jgi:hypothetical protein
MILALCDTIYIIIIIELLLDVLTIESVLLGLSLLCAIANNNYYCLPIVPPERLIANTCIILKNSR